MNTDTGYRPRALLIMIVVLITFGSGSAGYGQSSTVAALSGLTVSPVDVAGFTSDVTEYHVGVAGSVTQITITPTASDTGATIQIGRSLSQSNTVSSGSGHVVSLDEGLNRVFVWVTSYGGNTRKGYAIIVGRGVDAWYGWKAADDFNTLRAAGNRRANGIWSDGATMWVADEQDGKLYAYNMRTKARDAAKDFNTLAAAGNESPEGIWSDGITMWVADWSDRKLYAYDMATRARDRSKDVDRQTAGGGNLHPKGIWSDGTTMWVAYSFGGAGHGKVLAHTMGTRSRDTAKDFNTLQAAGNEHPDGIWSDGATMWVSDDRKLYAYDMLTKGRIATLDFNTLEGAYSNIVPTGIWSDGATMWVADANGKIFSFNMPPSPDATLSGLTVGTLNGHTVTVDLERVGRFIGEYILGFANDVTQITVTATANHSGATIDIDGSAVASGTGYTVSLEEGRNDIIITVTAQDGSTKRGYAVAAGRGSDAPFGWKVTDDFNDLGLANNVCFPRGIWSDGTEMWVACDDQINKDIGDTLFVYDTASKKRQPDFLSLNSTGKNHLSDVWSDGTTFWVAYFRDGGNKLHAYRESTRSRDASKDIDTHLTPFGIWSDGRTMWAVGLVPRPHVGGGFYYVADLSAINLTTNAREPGKEFNALDDARNDAPAGIWSDGTTLWVVDRHDVKLYAYNILTKRRDAAKDFNTLRAAGNRRPFGIWSDGETMWVVDDFKRKIYSYNMPSSNTVTAVTDFNGDGRTDFADFFLFADAYGGTDPKFDLDGSGTVDFADFFKFVDAFGA